MLLDQFFSTDISLEEKISTLDLDYEEKATIRQLIHELFHSKLLVVILDNLDTKKRETFLKLIDTDNATLIIDYVKTNIPELDSKIKTVREELSRDILCDFEEDQ